MKKWLVGAALAALVAVYAWPAGPAVTEPIRIGVLHSLTGTMAISEKVVAEAVALAVDEINAEGGLLGRRVELVSRDGRSDNAVFAAEAERLITEERVCAIFGCWTSSSRKSVRPVVEKRDHLLFYPVQYEGLEASPNIVYMGAAPNQQIIPAVHWCLEKLGKRVYLVGSDYVFPRTANQIIRAHVDALGGEIAGERYVLLGGDDVAEVVADIVRTQPHAILNTLNGSTNVAFFTALRQAGITPDKVPTISFSIGEPELAEMGASAMAGDYAAWNYFQSLKNERNKAFVAAVRRRQGEGALTSDPMEAAYLAVHLWAQAVRAAGTADTAAVRAAVRNQSRLGPEGLVVIDAVNQHAWKTARLGRIQGDGQFQVVWDSGAPVRPVPFPIFRSRAGWEAYLEDLHRGWGGRWANPGDVR